MKAKNLSAYSMEELQTLLEATIQDNFQPTLALVFISPNLPFQQIPDIFKKKNISIVGCTTMGEIYNEEICDQSISVLLMDIDPVFYSIYQKEYKDTTYATAFELGQKAASTFNNPGIIVYSGGITVDGEKLVYGIKDGAKKEIPLYGGLAGDDGNFQETHCFTDNSISNGGLVALIFDLDKIQLDGLSYSGWDDFGSIKKITKSDGNIIYEIDGKPAAQEFQKYFGGLQEDKEQEITIIPGQYPLKIIRGNDTSIVRSVMVSDKENQSLVLAGGVKEGDNFVFCIPPDFSVINSTIKNFERLKEKISKVDAVIMNSCGARLQAFGPMLEDEIDGIYNYWKKPMIGIFAYGEIGNTNLANNNCEFHNVTCSLVTITDKVI